MKAVVVEIRTQILILGTLVGLMWGLEILDTYLFRHGLDTLGIIPRQPIGLRGILLAPFLHGSFGHLSANTVPFVVLGWLIMAQSIANFVTVSVICVLLGGLGTWILGANGVHIGASGVIFGYLGFLLARYYFDRRLSSGLVALFVGCTYGSVLWGILPSVNSISGLNISWEMHLFGFLSGIVAASVATDN
jgi:membrane associated rhomboid family serine protease